jgi:zinc D-Ala-D-Ala carboxypeptidase
MTQLTEHFSLEELCTTSTGLDNTPPPAMFSRLKTLAIFGEKVRAILGNNPINIDSAFRSEAVNEAVGGVTDSAHAEAYAMDITCDEFGTPWEIANALSKAQEEGKIDFDQLIYEVTWVHISRDPQLRNERLTHPTAGGYLEGLVDAA